MTVRNDFTVAWYDDPRSVTVAAPATTVPLQDIHDTLVSIMDSEEGQQFPDLIFSEGKAADVTGIVSILQNAQFAFEPRNDKLETGTVTTPDTTGRTLTDTTAAFQTNLVTRGDVVLNATDGSHATVLTVVSETVLLTTQLAGGVDNQWDSADSYTVFGYVLCTISGGDLFAVDSLGADLDPILTSFGVVGPIVEQSTSPAAVPIQPATVLESGITWNEAMMAILASGAGLADGFTGVAGSKTVHYRNRADSKNRITATVDEFGNRTSLTLDLT